MSREVVLPPIKATPEDIAKAIFRLNKKPEETNNIEKQTLNNRVRDIPMKNIIRE